jgi:hypothetical protein
MLYILTTLIKCCMNISIHMKPITQVRRRCAYRAGVGRRAGRGGGRWRRRRRTASSTKTRTMLDAEEGTGDGHWEVVRGSVALRRGRTSRRGRTARATGKIGSSTSFEVADRDLAGGDGRWHDAGGGERGGRKSLHLE